MASARALTFAPFTECSASDGPAPAASSRCMVGEIGMDGIGDRREAGRFDRIEIGQILNQPEQMARGLGNIRGVTGIFVG